MKSLAVLLSAVAFLVLSGKLSADDKTYAPTDNEELYGVWVNEDYRGQKIVFYSDGTWGVAFKAKEKAVGKSPYEIKEKWTDSEGNIWYKATIESPYRGSGYLLVRLSNSGNTYESVWDGAECPKKIDQNAAYYRIRYRQ